jgi:integration host factor beta subunit
MTKSSLIDHIAESTSRSKKDVEHVVDAVLGAIGEALGRGEKVDLRGFGSFQVNRKKERQGRNPRTGESVTIAARTVAVFKPGKELAERVNETTASGTGRPDAGGEPAAQPSDGSAKVHGDKIEH